ncbi:hypothetical protein [Streptomyces sp. 3N207]|uniref:hypothetical protein n=1 Tax=Streptomyces sp. 3N207 TaxID=3457417 RepID=UPI003FD5C082
MSDHEEKVTPESGEMSTKDRNQTIKRKKTTEGGSGQMSTTDRNQTIKPTN